MPSQLSIPSFRNFGQKYQSTSPRCTYFSLLSVIPPHNYVLCSESLYESDQLPKSARDIAALLASKVYYYLGEYDEALSFALGAGSAFEAEARDYNSGEYVETVICTSPYHVMSHRCFSKHALLPSQSNRQIHSSALGRSLHGNQDRSSIATHHRVHIPALYRRRRIQAGAFRMCPGPISYRSLSFLRQSALRSSHAA